MATDPYLDWLGIPAEHRPPTFYDLLGLPLFESDRERIEAAAMQRTAAVRQQQLGADAARANQMLEELAGAHACLSNAQRKQAYDAELRRRLNAPAAVHDGAVGEPSPAGTQSRATRGPEVSSDSTWTLDFQPHEPSLTRRGRGAVRTLASWLVGIGVLAGAGVIGVKIAQRMQDQLQQNPQSSTESTPTKTAAPVAATTDAAMDPSQAARSRPAEAGASTRSTEPRATKPESAGTAAAAKPARRTENVLAGDLKKDRTLAASSSPWYLDGTVTVHRGATLAVEAGTELIAGADSKLVVHGKLAIAGRVDAPVRFHAEPAGSVRWAGVLFEGESCEARLRGTIISDADAALTLAGAPSQDASKFDFDSCLLTGNGTGLKIETFSSPRVKNTAIVRNRDDAIAAREDDGVYLRVTLAANGGKGYVGTGKPAPQFEECSVVGNAKGGIHCAVGAETFRARWSVVKCNLFSNGPFELFCEHPGGVTVNEIYWGPAGTRELRGLGFNEKKKPRSRIWDALHPKYHDSGVVFVQNSSQEFITSASADAAVLAMAGGKPIDLAKLTGPRHRGPSGEELADPPEVPILFAELAAQLRELIPARQYDEASRVLDEALANPELKDVADLIRAAQEDVRLLRELWRLAAERIGSLRPGDPASVGGIRGELVEFRDGQVSIRASNVVRKAAFAELRPSDIIFLLTGSNESDDAESRKKIWLFLLADKHGSGADVDHWAHLAAAAGADLKGRGIYLIPKGKAAVRDDP